MKVSDFKLDGVKFIHTPTNTHLGNHTSIGFVYIGNDLKLEDGEKVVIGPDNVVEYDKTFNRLLFFTPNGMFIYKVPCESKSCNTAFTTVARILFGIAAFDEDRKIIVYTEDKKLDSAQIMTNLESDCNGDFMEELMSGEKTHLDFIKNSTFGAFGDHGFSSIDEKLKGGLPNGKLIISSTPEGSAFMRYLNKHKRSENVVTDQQDYRQIEKNVKPQTYKRSSSFIETIICSAIWYKDLELKKSYLLEPKNIRPIGCDSGIVFSGWRHPNCLYQMCAITGLRNCEAGGHVQGFLTNKNRFVDRIEAASIAMNCGQIDKLKFGTKLYSEDLY